MIALGATSASVDLLTQTDGVARHAKLLHAAQQFEAIMLEAILKPLEKGAAVAGDDEDAGSAGPLQSFGVQAMAASLAKSGALGFAEKITDAIERHDPKTTLKKTLTSSQVGTVAADNAVGGSLL